MHHSQALTEQPNDEVVHKEAEETCMGEVAQKKRVYVALVESERGKGEVVHVLEHIVRWPDHVKPVKECI